MALLPRIVHPNRLRTGLLYGPGVWAAGYLPALRLYPSVKRDAQARTASMIGAYPLFGSVMSMQNSSLDRIAGRASGRLGSISEGTFRLLSDIRTGDTCAANGPRTTRP
jgi:hypothetical protein